MSENGTRPYGLTAQQVEALLRPIKPHRVLQAQGQSHLPAYDVAAHLTRLFGFVGWDTRLLEMVCIQERNDVPGKNGWYVTYRCQMRLTIKDRWGNVVKSTEDVATGSAQNQPDLGKAHDLACKSARSYALKRCATDLGDQFGLSLYNKGGTAMLVGTTLVGNDGAVDADPERFAPVPLSLGNDEWQVDEETGEIASGVRVPQGAPATTSAPASTRRASPARQATLDPGRPF